MMRQFRKGEILELIPGTMLFKEGIRRLEVVEAYDTGSVERVRFRSAARIISAPPSNEVWDAPSYELDAVVKL